jgi:patatin-related protein
MPTLSSPNIEPQREVRFAVVMYGGVSLAIYINGITQELLSMVRSTAEAYEDDSGQKSLSGTRITSTDDAATSARKLRGTERVYRKLSYLLSDEQLLADYESSLESSADTKTPVSQEQDRLDDLLEANNTDITTRFVVDILSGTSAGGINAIFLAKALANNQSIEKLKQLWVEEGDIGVLINDKKSLVGLHLDNQDPPRSLLNSRRMYFKLVKAFVDMGMRDENFRSPYVNELDLFVTTTDIQGLPLPIRLSDMNVLERRHRDVFRFKYAAEDSAFGAYCNDFSFSDNPFLAFAARCTSSFPFAFEPMKLCDIDEVLDTLPVYRNDASIHSNSDRWRKFFTPFIDPETGRQLANFQTRAFGDGGYLDNKPFSYPTETLNRRDAPVPVDRKLIYIEPSPEHLGEAEQNQVPNAIVNAKAALLDLPGYETIRADIERVIERNRLINRVNRISTLIEKDLDEAGLTRPKLEEGEWEKLDLAGMVGKFGIYYIPYRRLRIAAATDELAKLVSRLTGIDENSANFFAVRVLIRAWREINYPDYHKPADADGQKPKNDRTANQFLIDYDFKYWLRRITFIRARVDELYRLDQLPVKADGVGVDVGKINDREKSVLGRLATLRYHQLDYAVLTAEEKLEIRKIVAYLKCEFGEVYRQLRLQGRASQQTSSAKAADSFAALVGKIRIEGKLLNYLLGLDGSDSSFNFAKLNEDECVARAKNLLTHRSPADLPDLKVALDEAAKSLRQELQGIVGPKWTRCKELLKPVKDGTTERRPLPAPSELCKASGKVALEVDEKITDSIREYLWLYFSQFDDYDQIRFPILYGTQVGESDIVEIFRISPEDAPSLINEKDDGETRRKLAGTALFHFGAFLDRVWRENDIMWGRLDGAERLITALMPEPKNVREQLIAQAHEAILMEEMPTKTRKELSRLLADALIRTSSRQPFEEALRAVVGPLQNPKVKSRLAVAMRACLQDKMLLDFMKQHYEVDRELEPKPLLRSMARATQVTGKIFDDIAKANQVDSKAILWIARAGQLFWGLVEVAVPGSIANLLMFHWLRLLYVFEVVMVVAAVLLGDSHVKTLAWSMLGLTFGINLAVLLLRDAMRGKRAWARAVAFALLVALLFFSAVGFDNVFNLDYRRRFVGWLYTHGLLGWLRAARDWIVSLFTK